MYIYIYLYGIALSLKWGRVGERENVSVKEKRMDSANKKTQKRETVRRQEEG